MPRVDAATTAYLALDALSALMALLVAWFFLRSERLLPARGFGALALAFVALAAGYAVTALSLPPLRASALLDPARAGAVLLGSALLAVHYVGKRARWSMQTWRISGAAILVALTGFGLLLVVPGARILAPLLLVATSFLVIMEVRAKSLWDFRVPLAFVCLALTSYTVAIADLAGNEPVVLPIVYAWRLAGLAMLLSVIWPSRRFSGG